MTNTEQKRAVVLGGGGVAGIAWEMGVLAALLDHGIDVNDADLVVGTSAGSVVGAALRFGVVRQVLESQLTADDPAETVIEQQELTHFSTDGFQNMMADAARGAGSEQEARARLGVAALDAGKGLSEEAWVSTIHSLLPAQTWPAKPLKVTAVNADDGAFTVFDAASGVGLALAVAASCTVPGAWPPVTINGSPYMDGGMRSATNADVAAGYDKVLVLSCGPEAPESPFGPSLPRILAKLSVSNDTFLIEANEASLTAFGTNMLLQSSRRPSAAAGLAQGKAAAEAVKLFWGE
jgi:NTE family protein